MPAKTISMGAIVRGWAIGVTVVLAVLAAASGWTIWRFELDLWIIGLCYVSAASVFTFTLFGWDKARAKGFAGTGRVPESTLLLACFLGGSPGGLLGRMVFRHKTQKAKFRLGFWLVVSAQVITMIVIVALKR